MMDFGVSKKKDSYFSDQSNTPIVDQRPEYIKSQEKTSAAIVNGQGFAAPDIAKAHETTTANNNLADVGGVVDIAKTDIPSGEKALQFIQNLPKNEAQIQDEQALSLTKEAAFNLRAMAGSQSDPLSNKQLVQLLTYRVRVDNLKQRVINSSLKGFEQDTGETVLDFLATVLPFNIPANKVTATKAFVKTGLISKSESAKGLTLTALRNKNAVLNLQQMPLNDQLTSIRKLSDLLQEQSIGGNNNKFLNGIAFQSLAKLVQRKGGKGNISANEIIETGIDVVDWVPILADIRLVGALSKGAGKLSNLAIRTGAVNKLKSAIDDLIVTGHGAKAVFKLDGTSGLVDYIKSSAKKETESKLYKNELIPLNDAKKIELVSAGKVRVKIKSDHAVVDAKTKSAIATVHGADVAEQVSEGVTSISALPVRVIKGSLLDYSLKSSRLKVMAEIRGAANTKETFVDVITKSGETLSDVIDKALPSTGHLSSGYPSSIFTPLVTDPADLSTLANISDKDFNAALSLSNRVNSFSASQLDATKAKIISQVETMAGQDLSINTGMTVWLPSESAISQGTYRVAFGEKGGEPFNSAIKADRAAKHFVGEDFKVIALRENGEFYAVKDPFAADKLMGKGEYYIVVDKPHIVSPDDSIGFSKKNTRITKYSSSNGFAVVFTTLLKRVKTEISDRIILNRDLSRKFAASINAHVKKTLEVFNKGGDNARQLADIIDSGAKNGVEFSRTDLLNEFGVVQEKVSDAYYQYLKYAKKVYYLNNSRKFQELFNSQFKDIETFSGSIPGQILNQPLHVKTPSELELFTRQTKTGKRPINKIWGKTLIDLDSGKAINTEDFLKNIPLGKTVVRFQRAEDFDGKLFEFGIANTTKISPLNSVVLNEIKGYVPVVRQQLRFRVVMKETELINGESRTNDFVAGQFRTKREAFAAKEFLQGEFEGMKGFAVISQESTRGGFSGGGYIETYLKDRSSKQPFTLAKEKLNGANDYKVLENKDVVESISSLYKDLSKRFEVDAIDKLKADWIVQYGGLLKIPSNKVFPAERLQKESFIKETKSGLPLLTNMGTSIVDDAINMSNTIKALESSVTDSGLRFMETLLLGAANKLEGLPFSGKIVQAMTNAAGFDPLSSLLNNLSAFYVGLNAVKQVPLNFSQLLPIAQGAGAIEMIKASTLSYTLLKAVKGDKSSLVALASHWDVSIPDAEKIVSLGKSTVFTSASDVNDVLNPVIRATQKTSRRITTDNLVTNVTATADNLIAKPASKILSATITAQTKVIDFIDSVAFVASAKQWLKDAEKITPSLEVKIVADARKMSQIMNGADKTFIQERGKTLGIFFSLMSFLQKLLLDTLVEPLWESFAAKPARTLKAITRGQKNPIKAYRDSKFIKNRDGSTPFSLGWEINPQSRNSPWRSLAIIFSTFGLSILPNSDSTTNELVDSMGFEGRKKKAVKDLIRGGLVDLFFNGFGVDGTSIAVSESSSTASLLQTVVDVYDAVLKGEIPRTATTSYIGAFADLYDYIVTLSSVTNSDSESLIKSAEKISIATAAVNPLTKGPLNAYYAFVYGQRVNSLTGSRTVELSLRAKIARIFGVESFAALTVFQKDNLILPDTMHVQKISKLAAQEYNNTVDRSDPSKLFMSLVADYTEGLTPELKQLFITSLNKQVNMPSIVKSLLRNAANGRGEKETIKILEDRIGDFTGDDKKIIQAMIDLKKSILESE